jgi:hypothetical protein
MARIALLMVVVVQKPGEVEELMER